MNTVEHPSLLFFLGNNPELAHREIEAVATILPFPWSTSMVRPDVVELKPDYHTMGKSGLSPLIDPEFLKIVRRLQNRLGGTVKIAVGVSGVEPATVTQTAIDLVKAILPADSERRIEFGVSVYGDHVRPDALGGGFKRAFEDAGVKVRRVPTGRDGFMSSAQVWHNRLDLARQKGEYHHFEISSVENWMAVTLAVQNVPGYSERDFGIPFPDAVSGMLPPKLAQTMVNLALDGADPREVLVYDPFCGNGRVVLESYLMGAEARGSDIEEVKVSATLENLTWLAQTFHLPVPEQEYAWVQDATDVQAPTVFATHQVARPWYLVTEPYLGRPLRQPLEFKEQEEWLTGLAPIFEGFLAAWSTVKKESRPVQMLVVFPEAKVEGGHKASLLTHLVDRLAQMGYDHITLSHYARPDALVGRDLVLLRYRDS